MTDANEDIESLRKELNEFKNKIENRNVFDEMAEKILEFVKIESRLEPMTGNVINEGEEFKFIVSISYNHINGKNFKTLDLFELQLDFDLVLSYRSNCKQKLDNQGKQMFSFRNCDGILIDKNALDYVMFIETSPQGNRYDFQIRKLSFPFPIEITYQLIAPDHVDRTQSICDFYYNKTNSILKMAHLHKILTIPNEVIKEG